MWIVAVESLQSQHLAGWIRRVTSSARDNRGFDAHLHVTRAVTCAACGQPPKIANWYEHWGQPFLRLFESLSQPSTLILDSEQCGLVSNLKIIGEEPAANHKQNGENRLRGFSVLTKQG